MTARGINRQFLSWSAAILLAAVDFVVFAEGLTVVVTANPIPAEQTAAEELVAYLEKATGERPIVVSEGGSVRGKAIHLGSTALARKAVAGLDRFDAEEWTVKSVGSNLVIAGGRPRGVLYGVYHFLEDVLGVRWLTPTIEDVPTRKGLPLKDIDLRGKPAMPYRHIYYVPGNGGGRFRARNRMNVVDVRYGGGAVYGGSAESHTLYSNLGKKDEILRLFREHPAWFPLINGRRRCYDGPTQFCMTNPDLRRYWTEKLRERIRADRERARRGGVPDPLYYAVDMNDGYDGFCRCADCAAIIEREGGTAKGGTAGLMLDFVNHVAAELEAEAPNSKFQMMALNSTEAPPKFLKARRNVTVRLCDTTSNMLVPWTDPQNARHYSNLLAWRDHVGAIAMWDYQITFGAVSAIDLPTPAERTFAADIRTLRDAGGDGIFFEHEHPVSSDMRDLKVWLEFKLAENPDLDGDALIVDFTDRLYGPAAGAAIRRYRAILGRAADSTKARVGWYPRPSDYAFVDAKTLLAALCCRAEALAAVRGDEELKKRVDRAFMSLDRLVLVRSAAFSRQFEKLDPPRQMPDLTATKERYRRVFEHGIAEIGLPTNHYQYVSNVKALRDFTGFLGKARNLPIPEKFKDIPRDALFLIPATFALTHFNGMRRADDPSSPAGCAIVADMQLVRKIHHEYYPLSVYNWPFRATVQPTMQGDKSFQFGEAPAKQPVGYHWYSIGKDVQLRMDTMVAPWPGVRLPVDGVVSDVSELGQKYDLYVSVKIEGPDVFATGKATCDNLFYVDQLAVVRKTRNADAGGRRKCR